MNVYGMTGEIDMTIYGQQKKMAAGKQKCETVTKQLSSAENNLNLCLLSSSQTISKVFLGEGVCCLFWAR